MPKTRHETANGNILFCSEKFTRRWWDMLPHCRHCRIVFLSKSSQVSPNARRRAQCKGGGAKKNYRYTKNCTTYRHLSENVVATFTWNRNPGNMEAEHPIGQNFSQQFPNSPKLCTCKIFRFSVPSLLWASTRRICWKWLPRKCSPHPAFGK